jgi:hypothetical protein
MPTAVSDIILAAQQRCDRVNASTITPQEWLSYLNSEAARLWAILTSAYEDYGLNRFQFTLPGAATNSIQVGANTINKDVNDFAKLRGVWRQISASGGFPQWAPVLRVNSYMESSLYSTPALNPILGNLIVAYQLLGSTLEILPIQSASGTYLLAYTPCFTKFTQTTEVIDGTWISMNGIEEYIVLGMAWKALVKEESTESANIIKQEQSMLEKIIMMQIAPRDDAQPGRIQDTKRVRGSFGIGGNWGGGLGPY